MDSLYLTECAADNRSLEKLLTPVLQTTLAMDDSDGRIAGPLQILDLACGPCREVEAVSFALQHAVPGRPGEVRFVGADIRGAQIEEARERGRRLASSQLSTEFLDADCSKLKQHREIGTEFDMVFLRHQNFWDHPIVWRRIFEEGLERLHDTGLLVITSYFDKEHELAIKAISKAGAQLVTSVRNADSRQLRTPGKSVDRHIAVFRHHRKLSCV